MPKRSERSYKQAKARQVKKKAIQAKRTMGTKPSTRPSARPSSTIRRKVRKYRPNEPCPCDSGKKFKRCHGEAVSWIRAKRAYGRLDKQVDGRRRAYMEEYKKALPCKQGCFQCCRAQVLAVEAEGLAFADYLKDQLKDQLKEVRAKFEAWYAKLVENQLDVEVTPPRLYHGTHVWCPILDIKTGRCSQYNMRPVICRTHYSLNVEDCDEWQTTAEGLAALSTDDLLGRPMIEIGYGGMSTVSYWQFWVGKHLECSFAAKAPPLFAKEAGRPSVKPSKATEMTDG